ncbi:MAG: aliphatic sulfonate ABC transporter substrate-binding protein [Actinomycetota bacterium]|nr:aliphatic sulfonate ABC transporter substrate-binding protein [Actinomycetota bacterium]
MTKLGRIAFAVLASVGLVVALAACGKAGSSQGSASSSGTGPTTTATAIPAKAESGTFQMGIEPWLGYGPWQVAKQKGFFTANGINVNISNFTTDDQINAALASGKLDGANIATHTMLRLAAAGLPITAVLLEDESETADAVLAGPGINSIKDLKGKKVAYEEGTTSDILLHHALAANGMTINDIKKVPIPAADAGAAAIAGKVDAAVTYEPYLTAALQKSKSFRLIYSASQDPGLVGDVFVVRNDVLKSKPGQIAALLKSWGQSVAYYRSNTADAQAIITKAVGAKPGDLTTAFKGVKIYSLPDNVAQFTGAYLNKTILDVLQAAKQAGLIKGNVNPGSLIDSAFVTHLAKR